MTFIWIPITLFAATAQVARNAFQRGLLGDVGPWGATLVRFLFGLPFSVVMLAGALLLTPGARFHFTAGFWTSVSIAAAAQVFATAVLLVAFRRAGFAVGTALQQSSLPFAAVIGWLAAGDALTPVAWSGVAVASVGLVALSWPRGAGGPQPVSGGAFGIAAGALFAIGLVGYRVAGLALEPQHPATSAMGVLVVAQALQSAGLGLYLLIRTPAALKAVARGWRQSLGAGLFGALASAGWFVALALAPAAAVRAVGVAESPIAAAAGRRLFAERLHPAQVIAGVAVLAGVLMTALGRGGG
jgi:drug/metabolite transporter (DMT)-like permease